MDRETIEKQLLKNKKLEFERLRDQAKVQLAELETRLALNKWNVELDEIVHNLRHQIMRIEQGLNEVNQELNKK